MLGNIMRMMSKRNKYHTKVAPFL